MSKRLVLSALFLSIAFVSVVGAASSQRPDAPTFAQTGPYEVGTREITLDDPQRPLDVTVWYPADPPGDANTVQYQYSLLSTEGQAYQNAPADMSDAPYPLVVFSHGSGGFRYQSLWLTEHLASHGFVVMASDHPGNTILDNSDDGEDAERLVRQYVYRPNDVLRQIDHAETMTNDGPLSGVIDTDNVAVSGHSFGGYTAMAASGARLNFDQLADYCESVNPNSERDTVCFLNQFEAAIAEARDLASPPDGAWPPTTDPRIKAAVALAPWNGPILDQDTLAARTTPTMIVVGTSDPVTIPERDAYAIYRRMDSAPRHLITLENAAHFVFVNDCPPGVAQFGLFDRCSDPVWDMQRAHDLVNHKVTAFLLHTFDRDASAADALEPGSETFPGLTHIQDEPDSQEVAALVPEVIDRVPHDTGAFTQGLLLHDGILYESTGQYGESDLRRVDPETGDVLQERPLDSALFGEGLAHVDDRLYQLTWQSNRAFVYDRNTFEPLTDFFYDTEGWGLCYDGEALYMTDGSSTLYKRDPGTFGVMEAVPVTLNGEQQSSLNELACVDGSVYANVWQTNRILRINPDTGHVTGVINVPVDELLTSEERTNADVLNGIAYDAETGHFFITGKYWPWMYEVRFTPADS